jgi:hypothetical protein
MTDLLELFLKRELTRDEWEGGDDYSPRTRVTISSCTFDGIC